MCVRGSLIKIDTGILSSIVTSIVFILSLYLIPSLISPNQLLANDLSISVSQNQPQNHSLDHRSKQTQVYPELDTSELNTIKQRGTLRIIVPANLSIGALSRRIVSPLYEPVSYTHLTLPTIYSV